ncbi:MAG: dienelactone hydrolase family protein [Candidatus Binatia bacterium]|nr:dienelactone hydrolase family protein [Candidatus Binatia bacterium]
MATSGETIKYNAGGTELIGWAETGTGSTPRPGVLVVHEWWGLNDYVKGRAQQLAALGYEALAVDMYGGGQTAANPEEANGLMSAALGDVPALEQRFQAAVDALKARPGVDGSKIAAIGYCFGGAVVLHAARIGLPLAGVTSFHGSLGSFHKPAPGSVQAKVLVCHGAADALVPEEDVAAFKAEMDAAGADYRFEAYPGAFHSFSNSDATAAGEKYGMPLKYDADADARSWADMSAFFGKIFG